jgi:hypothetical protein
MEMAQDHGIGRPVVRRPVLGHPRWVCPEHARGLAFAFAVDTG